MKDKKQPKKKKKLTPCNENAYIDDETIREDIGVSKNAKIIMG